MDSANRFVEKIRRGGVCVGTGITFSDVTATEALCDVFDFVWIDMEHNALSLESVQGHLIATKGSRTLPGSCLGFPASPGNPYAFGAAPFSKGEFHATAIGHSLKRVVAQFHEILAADTGTLELPRWLRGPFEPLER